MFESSSRSARFALGLILTGVLVASIAAAATRREIVGVPTMGGVGIHRTNADIMREAALHANDPVKYTLMNEHEFEREDLELHPGSQRVASIPPMAPEKLIYRPKGSTRFEVFSPQTLGPNFTAATLSGTNPTLSFPPDCNGAVGPTQYIVAVNGRIVSFNKTTGVADGVMNASTDAFFTSVRAGSGTSDPEIRYDRLSGRWFLSIINVSTPNRWLLGVSDAASNGTITAGTVWTFFFFIPATVAPSMANGNTCLSDYPSLGIDANALYMGVDEFCGASPQTFQQTDGFVIRKSSVLGAGPIVVTAFREFMSANTGFTGMWAPRGVDNYDPSSNEGYFFGTDGNAYGVLNLLRVANPGGTPTLSANIPITVPATNQALNVPHLGNANGTNGFLDPLDDRPFAAYIKNQQLWTAHNIKVDNTGVANAVDANNTRDASRWYQFNVPVNSGTPTIVQSGTVFTQTATNLTTERHYWMPTIMVSGQGHAAMGMSTAGTAERANAATVGRLAGDPLGTMQVPLLVTSSATAYNPASDPGSATRPRRWGDYSAVSLDPIDDMSMWQVAMFCDATNSYGVRVTKLVAPGPAAPSALPDVAAGLASVSVTLTGTSTSGTGFYDPGANLPGVPAYSHLTASVTAGAASGTPPTVVSATYVNPTTVNLVLNTSAATPSVGSEKYTITITNPDGQASSAAVVHVITPYTITASAGPNGSISPSGAVAVSGGSNQTFTITPAACYHIDDVLVDGVSVGAVASYTFTNISADHTISASFALNVYAITASAGAGGSITPSGGVPVNCGANQSFAIAAAACNLIADVVVDGVSQGPVSSYTFTNVQAPHSISASFTLNAMLPASNLAVAQQKLGNDTDGTTKITVTYTAPSVPGTVEVWRRGFGNYPLYDNSPGAGSAPSPPASYPPAGWTLTSVTASGQSDEPPTRDFYYYVAYGKNSCGDASTVSNMTTGTLDYHLGDVSNGVSPGSGDNVVNTLDASLLGAHYGATGASLTGFEYLDVGPTTNASTDGRPTTDSKVGFDDLLMFALNYTPRVSLVAKGLPTTQGGEALRFRAPPTVTAGTEFDVPLVLSGAGALQAISVSLRWNEAVVEPIETIAGDLVTSQGGLLFSPGPGCADAALLGAGSGFTGQGVIATVRFRAKAEGFPMLAFGQVIGRDERNRDVTVSTEGPLAAEHAVSSTVLLPVIPNPTQGSAFVQYALARQGPVDLAIFTVDGRRVKTLLRGSQDAGRYQFVWDGADEQGVAAKSGVFFVRLRAAGIEKTRMLTVIH